MGAKLSSHKPGVSVRKRYENCPHNGAVLWFTGLSGAGKSTLAYELEERLFELGIPCRVLDGDHLRGGLCEGLGYTLRDRLENVRRAAHAASLLQEAGVLVLCSLISPLKDMRQMARNIIGKEFFYEIYVNTPLEICQKRDPKDLYARFQRGEIQMVSGLDSPYEPPREPVLTIDASSLESSRSVDILLENLYEWGVLKKGKSNA